MKRLLVAVLILSALGCGKAEEKDKFGRYISKDFTRLTRGDEITSEKKSVTVESTAEKTDYWALKIMKDFSIIKPAMTRGGVEKKFPMQGGFFSYDKVTYTHPDSPYIKIDVTFEMKKDSEGRAKESKWDKAKSVSSPYLGYMIID